MKALAINGSSRRDGNTADMLNLVLGELEKAGCETEHIQLAGHTINPCQACFACAGKSNCVFGDDIFQELYRKMSEADAIVVGSPTYSADVSSTLKAVIDRASVVSDTNPGMFRHKVGGAVAVARRAGAVNVVDTIHRFFLNKEMYVAGSTYWNIAYGRLPGEAMNDAEGVACMKNLGQNIAWLLKKFR
ncbi:MAG: flavodoxin family protein [Rikenella sp.]|nr:flavodoxin family protein [Rikenella sp.]